MPATGSQHNQQSSVVRRPQSIAVSLRDLEMRIEQSAVNIDGDQSNGVLGQNYPFKMLGGSSGSGLYRKSRSALAHAASPPPTTNKTAMIAIAIALSVPAR